MPQDLFRFRMAVVLLLVLASLWLQSRAQVSEPEVLFDSASQAYIEGNFEEAAALYEEILQKGWESGEVYYNLGNTYFRQGELGLAILNYERARRFLSGDSDLERNLQIANLRVVDKIEPLPEFPPVRWAKTALQLLPVKAWLWLTLFLYWVTLVLLASWVILRVSGFRRWILRGALGTAAGTLLALTLFASSYWLESSQVPAVILADEALARSAPGAGASELFRVHEGTRVQTGTRSAEWTEIILADGKVGWVPSDTLQVI